MKAQKALVIVDLQNDFLSPNGYLGKRGRNVKKLGKIIKPIKNLVEKFRGSGDFILFIRSSYDLKYQTKKSRKYIPVNMCKENTFGFDFYKIIPVKKEPVFIKHTYDAFSNLDFEKHLRKHKISELILCGVFTNVCVEFTARTGFTKGFTITIPSDCISTYWADLHKASIKTMAKYFAKLTTSKILIKNTKRKS